MLRAGVAVRLHHVVEDLFAMRVTMALKFLLAM